jgi:GNAT superfamily N-acetyltransferase
MKFIVTKTALSEILPLRTLFLQENNFQIRYNACHERGWTDSYLFSIDGRSVGYGSVKGNAIHTDRDTVFEFYVIPAFRNFSLLLFTELLSVSRAVLIECQSNDGLLTPLIYQFGKDINSDVILFEDHISTSLKVDGVIFRRRKEEDVNFEHKSEPEGDFILEVDKEIVATGGFLLHYNRPFADLYMEVKEPFRRRGLGSLIIQEIKRECYIAGRVPAARCNIVNIASKNTLVKGGLRIVGFMLLGNVKQKEFL